MHRADGSAASRRVGALIVFILALTLGLGGCKRDTDGELPAPSGEAIHAKRVAPGEFTIASAYPDKADDELAIAVEFSRPLAATQEFDKLIVVRDDKGGHVDGGWVLDDGAKVLRFRHVEPSKNYVVVAYPGLTAADGSRIGKELERKVYTGPLDPVVGFASQGSVLPARETRGLPVVSINVPEVDVEFLRVRDSELPKFFAEYQRGGRRGSWDLDNNGEEHRALTKIADAVYVNRFVLGGKANERVLTYLPIQDIKELQEPGLYFAVMKKAGTFSDDFETAFFTVSDLGVHVRAYKDKLFVHTASLLDGSGTGGVDLRVLDAKGEPVFKSTTDSNGNALLDYTLDASHVLVARRGSDVTMLPFNPPALDLSEFAVAGREEAWFDVFAWAGRDLYRPGETVHLSALLRDHDGNPIATAAGKAPQPIYVRYVQPDGKTLIESRLQPDAQGYVRQDQVIPSEAPTGRWRVEFRTDPGSKDAVEGMTLRVEEFLPERLKLDLSAQPVVTPGQPLKLHVQGDYLYGAPAAGNRFTARLAIAVEQHPFEAQQLPGYFFGDATLALPDKAEDVLDTVLDPNGRLDVDVPLPKDAKPVSPIALMLSGSVYETGGRSVNRSVKRVMWPADALVGVRPLFDATDGADANTNARFQLMRVDAQGRPRPAKGLRITLVRERRDYHWDYDEDSGWDYAFTRRFENVQTLNVDAGNDAVPFDFPVEWGDYRVDVYDPVTKLTSRYPFTAGWSWNDENRGLDARPDKVKLALDKTGYRAGDTLKVTVTPPNPGRGLLIVESDRMLYVQSVDVKAGSTFEIPVTKDWERHDVYVSALVFRGGSATSKVTPARAVGVAHVPMDRRDRRVAVGISVPAKTRPERDLPVTIAAPQLAGQRAHVVVSAVDVGILNITQFPVPDPAKHFFAQRRLGVDAYDIYGRVIESFDGGTARLKFGGDMALPALPQARRPTAHVQTVDLFAGPVALDAKGIARLKVAVPDFNGTLRVSAVVYSGGRFGSVAKESTIRAPILAEPSMPRVLAPGDSSRVTLDVQNFTGRAGSFKVNVDTTGPLALADGARTLTLAPEQKVSLTFPLTAKEGFGTGRVRIRIDGNASRVDRGFDLPVRPAWPQVVRTRTSTFDAPASTTLPADIVDGLIADSVAARLTVSPNPPIPFAAALQGALDYPYGCIEQTTSKGYAGLLLDDATARTLGVKGLDAKKRLARMNGAFARISGMQVASGHFSMWGDDDDSVNPLLTPYVAEFLLDARDAGFAIPDTVLQKALKAMSEDLLGGSSGFYGYDRREHLRFAYQAYAGYVLARVNRAPLGTLRGLYDNDRKQSITGLPLVHLGLALALQGDRARGVRAIQDGFDRDPDARTGYFGDYGSRVRDDALMLALTRRHGLAPKAFDPRLMALVREIDARRSAYGIYLSTQEQVALARLGKQLMVDTSRQVAGAWRVAGAASEAPAAKLQARLFDITAVRGGISFAPTGTGTLYATVDVAGIPRDPPAFDDSKIGIVRKWYTPDGQPWDGGKLEEGDALIVSVAITPQDDVPDALLTDLLPAGLEIENFNLGDEKQWADVSIDGIELADRKDAAEVKHEEFREDRYVAALKLSSGSTSRVFYMVRAVTPGTYTVPPSLVEDMYRPWIRGVGKASPAKVNVGEPGH
ncbi:alpha-2-macroglobulin family protein [Cognatilysobacter terrigena]|uniref:alpha-2-macroglobulin family protein n=1 Tax=Cognatilysobacter terrigena TaxID=2488749 RepID=UPI00105C0EBF|nr:alpha-2-macroglobulin [Lysobacter terrigena]